MAEIKKSCRIGQVVMNNGKRATVVQLAGDWAVIRYDDGAIEHVSENNLTHIVEPSELKGFRTMDDPFTKARVLTVTDVFDAQRNVLKGGIY